MSDDLVKRLGFHGFNGTENALHRTRRWTVERLEAKDRIAELEAERDEIMREALSLVTQWGPLNYPAGVVSQIDNMVAGIVARAEAAEALVAKSVDALERIAHASDVYGVEANAEDQGADTLAYAHKSTGNLARTTLAALKGTD